MVHAKYKKRDIAGMTATEQLSAINKPNLPANDRKGRKHGLYAHPKSPYKFDVFHMVNITTR